MRLPRFVLALLVGTLSCLLGLAPAHADSATGLAANAWIISDLAGQALTAVPQSSEVSSYEMGLAQSATLGTTAAQGVTAAPKSGSKLGMIINTVAVLGGLALLWKGDSSSPNIPTVFPPGTETYGGDPSCGLYSGTAITSVFCSNGSATVSVMRPASGGSYIGIARLGPNGVAAEGGACSCSANGFVVSRPPVGSGLTWEYTIRVGPTLDSSAGNTSGGTILGHAQIGAKDGSAVAPGAAPPTPAATVPHTITSTAQCIDSGGVTHTITNTTPSFTFTPSASFSFPQVPDIACPTGQWLKSGERHLDTQGTTETVPLVQPYTAPDWVGQQATQFPECFPVGATQCQLELYQRATVKHAEYPCHAYPLGAGNPCTGWFSDPDRATKYECRFGGTVVKMKRCQPYASTFTDGTVTATPPNPDTDLPEVVLGVDPTPEQTPNDSGCVPNWGTELLNPWWVYKASVCALKWAFVPQTSLQLRMQRIQAQVRTKVPFTWFAGLASIPGAVPGGSCPDWTIKVDGVTKNVVCDSSYTAAIRAARPVLAVFMGALALWPLIRSTAYAAFPIIKPQPGVLR